MEIFWFLQTVLAFQLEKNSSSSNTKYQMCGIVQGVKRIVHFEINFWYVLAYLKGIQDVGVFVSTVFSIFRYFWYFYIVGTL